MGKSIHFFGQLVKLLDHDKIIELSRSLGGERWNAM